MTGSTIGHYQILEKLGEGGMGVVYKARDVLLGRFAALKFLPSADTSDADRRRRFLQEAQSASALNHPNIVTIYEVGQADQGEFIAMELVDGTTLHEAINAKPLPAAKALAYAIQIADALAAAHAGGIVHRDLKPGNVMITAAGVVKVLDFGLAKWLQAVPASDETRTLAIEGPRTAEGAIVGTASYMSPEQAEGKPTDHRSDIFSFGAVLYEMLTGRRAFQGDSTVSTLAAILTADPVPIAARIGPLGSGELDRIVSRCLRKLPEKRWQHIVDVRIALEELKLEMESGRLETHPAPLPSPRGRYLSVAAAALLVAALVAAGAIWLSRREAPGPEQWRVRRLTADAGASLFPTMSADGRMVAYVSDRGAGEGMEVWVQQVGSGDPVRVTHNLPLCRQPVIAISPDGSRVAVHCGIDSDTIYTLPALGGLPKKLADGEDARFSPDGTQVSYMAPASGTPGLRSIWIVGADGGTPRELPVGRGVFGAPVWSPDGAGLYFIGLSDPSDAGVEDDWYFIPAAGGTPMPLGAAPRLRAAALGRGRNLAASPEGIWFDEGTIESANLYRMPVDAKSRKVSGDPVPVIVGASYSFYAAVSQDGRRVAFAAGNALSTNLWRARLDPKSGKVAGEPERITRSVEFSSRAPSPSRDGRLVAYLGGSTRAPEVRIREVQSGRDLRLAGAKEWSYVSLSRDSASVAFHSDERPTANIYVVPASGGLPKRICASCGRPVEWSLDGTKLLTDSSGPQRRDIQIVDIATGSRKTLLEGGEQQLTMPRLSPDGRYLCFSQIGVGRQRRIYIAPFTGEAVPQKDWTVLIDGVNLDRQPLWSPNGDLIYFLSERDGSRCVWAQRVDAVSRKAVGEPFAVHHMHQVRQDLMGVGVPAHVGLSIANGYLYYAAFELEANIWLAERLASAGR